MKVKPPTNGFSLQLKPVGCACNIKCDYCYIKPFRFKNGKQVFKIMSPDILERTIANLLETSRFPIITWHGGEPTLAGIDFFEMAIGHMKKYQKPSQKITNIIQTNATMITPEMARFFCDNSFTVSVSLDGPEMIHGIHRKTFGGNNSFGQTINGIDTLRNHGVYPAVICTVDQDTMPFAKEVFHFLVNYGFTDIKYSPVYDAKNNEFNMSCDMWFKYLKQVFFEWFELTNEDVHVRELDEVISWLSESHLNLCSSNKTCLSWVSVDPNGNLYPCEYLRQTHPYGNIKTMSLAEIPKTANYQSFYRDFLQSPPKCQACQYRNLCGNGCPATRVENGRLVTNGVYVYCEQRKRLYELIRDEFEKVIEDG